ncbi:MAG: hypothetical protein WA885_18770 [Phormidesmis sp.]
MAFVLALLIVGWLLAFALGAQAGFDNQPSTPRQPTSTVAVKAAAVNSAEASYREPVSVS